MAAQPYAPYPQAPVPAVPAAPAPTTVKIAAGAIFGIALIALIDFVLDLILTAQITNVAKEVGVTEGLTYGTTLVGGVIGMIFRVSLSVVLGIFILKRHNWARIVCFIMGGIGTLVSLLVIAGVCVASARLHEGSSVDYGSYSSTAEKIFALVDLATLLGIIVNSLVIVLSITIVVLLVLPASNQFFAPKEPAIMYPVQPVVPGAPAAYNPQVA
ncbi:MAG: hypothetical protein Q4P78_00970 [Rothia sp. (in: high G+C Gram-positive bacteria)]|uniref:hypothetical protein n=1 Tax=Rothia sp. (in: high G+C Gram-positive bacteria) TaxID=1885016 RepID=UPI0026DF2FB8|nr:hypothetical protein [Rothia sp. (in: high G+C Gram-positive bacteria)]MDO5749761.1 hypothetical protein [Rothia sp. (in: high G+C Gram-positive bacteria)]